MSLGGVRGKVRATLNENQVSFESRNGHALDIRLNAIKRVHHHDTNLVPGWCRRRFDPDVGGLERCDWEIASTFLEQPVPLATAHYITKQPTLIIDTNAEDCHVVYGPDLSIMRLCALIQRIQNGMTLEEAKSSVDNIVTDSDYPRTVNGEELEAIPEPVEIFPSAVINHFIDSMEETDDIIDAEVISPATVIDDLDIPIWEDEEEVQPQISDGLLARSKANLFTQRNQVMQNGWQPQTNQPAFDGVHRSPPTGVPSYGMLNQHGMMPAYSHPTHPQPTLRQPSSCLHSLVRMVHIFQMPARIFRIARPSSTTSSRT